MSNGRHGDDFSVLWDAEKPIRGWMEAADITECPRCAAKLACFPSAADFTPFELADRCPNCEYTDDHLPAREAWPTTTGVHPAIRYGGYLWAIMLVLWLITTAYVLFG